MQKVTQKDIAMDSQMEHKERQQTDNKAIPSTPPVIQLANTPTMDNTLPHTALDGLTDILLHGTAIQANREAMIIQDKLALHKIVTGVRLLVLAVYSTK